MQPPNQLPGHLTSVPTRTPMTVTELLASRNADSETQSSQRLVDLLSFANSTSQGARIVNSIFPQQTSSIPLTTARTQPRNLSNSRAARQTQQSPASLHPNFRRKTVCSVSCKYCEVNITVRGMKAILLADTRVELYSTDNLAKGRVELGMSRF
jgi:hypothetical protein